MAIFNVSCDTYDYNLIDNYTHSRLLCTYLANQNHDTMLKYILVKYKCMYICTTCTLSVTHVCTCIGGSQRVLDTIQEGTYVCTHMYIFIIGFV